MSEDGLFDGEIEERGDVIETIDFIRSIGEMIITGHQVSAEIENRMVFGASLVLAARVVEMETELCDALQQFVSSAYESGGFDPADALSLLARHHMARYGSPSTE
jgi:hypothetical protein